MSHQLSSKPFFSIIIPTLNEELYLPKLLKDITNQTFQNLELIVVDGQSEDHTVKKAQEFPNIQIVQTKKQNVSIQRNLGANHAQGKYLLFFDADTRIPGYFLEGIKYRITIDKPDVFTSWLSTKNMDVADKPIVNFMNVMLSLGEMIHYPAAYGAFIGCDREKFLSTSQFDQKKPFAEDSFLVRTMVAYGYSFSLFRDPRYTFSLRRFHTEGTVKLVRKYSQIQLKYYLTGSMSGVEKIYPMKGGAIYINGKKPPKLIGQFEDIMKHFPKIPTKEVIQQYIKSFFET